MISNRATHSDLPCCGRRRVSRPTPSCSLKRRDTANMLSDHALAERLARSSVHPGDGFIGQLELGRALLGQSRFEEAETVLVPLVGNEPNDKARENLSDAISGTVGHGLGRVDEALNLLQSIEHTATDPSVTALLRCHRATLLAFGARFTEAAELGMAALESVEDEAVRVRSLGSVGSSLVMGGVSMRRWRSARGPLSRPCGFSTFFPRHRYGQCLRAALRCSSPGVPMNPSSLSTWPWKRFRRFRSRWRLGPVPTGAGFSCSKAEPAVPVGASPTPLSVCVPIRVSIRRGASHSQPSPTPCSAITRRRGRQRPKQSSWIEARSRPTDLINYAPWPGSTPKVAALVSTDQLWAAMDLAASRGQRSFEIIILDDLLRLGEHEAAGRTRELAVHVDGAWLGGHRFPC